MAIQVLETHVCSCCWGGRVRACWSAVAAATKAWENQWLGAGGLVAFFPGRTRHWQNWRLLTLLALKIGALSSPKFSSGVFPPHGRTVQVWVFPGNTTQIFAHCWRTFSYLWSWFTQERTLKSLFWSSSTWEHLGINISGIIQVAQGSLGCWLLEIQEDQSASPEWVHKAVSQLSSKPKSPIKIVLSGRIAGTSAVKAVYSWYNIAWL